MAILKPISGHGNLVDNGIRDYLLGIGRWHNKYNSNRCHKITYINIAPDIDGKPNWTQRMDQDRIDKGTNIRKNKNRVRTYNHYIFSPSPNDNVTADELDKALKEWCERVFQNNFSIVIGYHNDNSNHVQHAHMIINNVNWNPSHKYRRIGTYVNQECWEYASQLWQYICKERGWYSFIDKQKADIENSINPEPTDIRAETDNFTKETENLFEIDEQYFKQYRYFSHDINYKRPYNKVIKYNGEAIRRPFSTNNGKNYTAAAKRAKEQGKHLWTDDIRNIVEIAYYQSKSIGEFVNNLEYYGVETEITDNKDFKYSHPSNPQWRVTGMKLGKDYARFSIINKFKQLNSNSFKYTPNAKFKSSTSKKIQALCKSVGIAHIDIKSDIAPPKLEEIAQLMRICSEYNVWTTEEIGGALPLVATDTERRALSIASNLMSKIDNMDDSTLKELIKSAPKIEDNENELIDKISIFPNENYYPNTSTNHSKQKLTIKEEHNENQHSVQRRNNRPHINRNSNRGGRD